MSSEKSSPSPTNSDKVVVVARETRNTSATDKTPGRTSVDERTESGNLSVGIGEEELTWLDIEAIDDLVYQFVFDDDKKGGGIGGGGGKINSKLREKANGNSETPKKNGGKWNPGGGESGSHHVDPEDPKDFEAPKTIASDSGISSAETEGSLQAFLTEQGPFVYYESPDHPLTNMSNNNNNNSKKKPHEKVHMNGTAGQQGPSGSRVNNARPEIPGSQLYYSNS